MKFRFVLPLSDTNIQPLIATYTHGKKPALRLRTS